MTGLPLLVKFLLLAAVLHDGIVHGQPKDQHGVYHLDTKGQRIDIAPSAYQDIHIFCYKGTEPSLVKFWSSADLRLRIDTDDYNVFMGANVTAVKELHAAHESSWIYSGLPWKPKSLKLSPFEPTCVGVLTNEQYQVTLQIWNVNFWQLGMTLIGFLLFFYAPSLCANAFFHYSSGVLVGICLSLIVLTYIMQKRFNFWLSFCFIFYSLSVYALTTAWYNLKTYIVEHHVIVLAYLVIVGGLSFGITYRVGPIQNHRTLNLIQWTMQLLALCLIFLSSYHQIASLSLALVILGWASIPPKLKTKVQVQYRKRFFKPKIKLLSEAEYLDQSRVVTERALKELRDYCRSPKCSPWKLASKLQTPSRFAEFVEGSSHLTQEEVMNYSHADIDEEDWSVDGDAGLRTATLTDDDDSDEIDLERELENNL